MVERFGDPSILTAVETAAAAFSGVLGCYAKHLGTGEEIGLRADAVMPTASTIKVGIMAELYRRVFEGSVDLAERIAIEDDDWRAGSGVLKEMQPGLAPTVFDLCRLMIIVSDNVATHLLVRLLGKGQINASFRAWGLAQTTLKMEPGDAHDARRYAVSTPRELGRLMELIATDALVSPGACAAMRDHLARQQHLEQIGRELPFNRFADYYGIDQPLRLMNKVGSLTGMRADVAIVACPAATFVLATVNEGSRDHGYGVDQEGNVLNGRVARALFDRWCGGSPAS